MSDAINAGVLNVFGNVYVLRVKAVGCYFHSQHRERLEAWNYVIITTLAFRFKIQNEGDEIRGVLRSQPSRFVLRTAAVVVIYLAGTMLQYPSKTSPDQETMQIVGDEAVYSMEIRPLASVNRCLVAVEGCGCQWVRVRER